MRLFRLVIGRFLVAVGFVSTLVAFFLIANTGKPPYMVVWGLGLLAMMLGFKFLPEKKKQRREYEDEQE